MPVCELEELLDPRSTLGIGLGWGGTSWEV